MYAHYHISHTSYNIALSKYNQYVCTISLTPHIALSKYNQYVIIIIMFPSYIAHITSKWRLYALEALLPQL